MWAVENTIGDIDPRIPANSFWSDAPTSSMAGTMLRESSRSCSNSSGYGKESVTGTSIWAMKGLARFVTGLYSRNQAIAAMVGILLAPEAAIIPPIRHGP